MPGQFDEIVGYSVFELFEECYVYNENECYIVGTEELAVDLMKAYSYSKVECRIDTVTLDDMLKDYGCSSGSFALDLQAYARFVELAKARNLHYEAKDCYLDSSTKIVEIGQKTNA